MSKKWNSPLQAMLSSDKQIETLTVEQLATQKLKLKNPASSPVVHSTQYTTTLPSSAVLSDLPNNSEYETILKVDPNICINWKYHDRPAFEVGDIAELAADIKANGQSQPAVARLIINPSSEAIYEIIAGERRMLAAKSAGIKLDIVVRNMTDKEAALCQLSENDQRKNLSDYAKGISYSKLIQDKIITAKELEIKLNKSQGYIRTLLSFARISQEVSEAIGDMSKITARSAYEIARWEEKGEEYKAALIAIAPKLRTGAVGEKKLEAYINEFLNKSHQPLKSAVEIKLRDGRHIFTWRNDSNGHRSIGFPKDIRELIQYEELEQAIITNIEHQLERKKIESKQHVLVRAD
jgi:ParB family chromosome partitioning protein